MDRNTTIKLSEIKGNRSNGTRTTCLYGGSSTGAENLQRCAQYGIVKINIFTDLVHAATNHLITEDMSYFEIQTGLCSGIETCFNHYCDEFQTQALKL